MVCVCICIAYSAYFLPEGNNFGSKGSLSSFISISLGACCYKVQQFELSMDGQFLFWSFLRSLAWLQSSCGFLRGWLPQGASAGMACLCCMWSVPPQARQFFPTWQHCAQRAQKLKLQSILMPRLRIHTSSPSSILLVKTSPTQIKSWGNGLHLLKERSRIIQ